MGPSFECGLSACCCYLAGVGGGVKRRLARKDARKERGNDRPLDVCARHEAAETSRVAGRYARLEVVDDEIRAYYERGMELDRVTQGYSRIEFVRTKEILGRYLPPRTRSSSALSRSVESEPFSSRV